jgi:hypothetical protein
MHVAPASLSMSEQVASARPRACTGGWIPSLGSDTISVGSQTLGSFATRRYCVVPLGDGRDGAGAGCPGLEVGGAIGRADLTSIQGSNMKIRLYCALRLSFVFRRHGYCTGGSAATENSGGQQANRCYNS